ncbi:MAG TPA: sigma 54-interacting transcriptional regulator [Polyangiaceae bacterium]
MHRLITSRPPGAGSDSGAPSSNFSSYRLLVLGQARMSTFPLPPAGQLTIGSASDCDIRVEEPGIAALHAVLRMGQRLSITDAGSGASTIVGSRRLERGETAPLAPGVIAQLGGVATVIQASGASTRLRHVRSHDYFEGRLEDECVRAEAQGGGFAVVRLSVRREQARAVEEAFSRHLRAIDLVAVYSSDEYELLLIDASFDKAQTICRWIQEHVAGAGLGNVAVGIACWHRDGRSPEALLAAAGDSLRGISEPPSTRLPSFGAIESLRPLIERVAAAHINVLILGETGVGKEVLARRIHDLSNRADRPMLCVNCAALSETLLESELFGHERGAFTGAVQAKPGLLEAAEGGTVLLDEIGEMPLSIQAKVLRVVEQRSVTRVGGLRARTIDVRFMSATHRDLEAEIARGNFREDLYYRLNGVSLVVPPLRERVTEIRSLAQGFVKQFAAQAGREPPQIASAALAVLARYAWPGNVRELRNVMERAVMLCQSAEIDLPDLPLERLGRTLPHERISENPPPARHSTPTSYAFSSPRVSSTPRVSSPPQVSSQPPRMSAPPPRVSAPPLDEPAEPLDDAERARIVNALERCGGNQTHAARLLGMSRRTLISRIERFGLPRPRKREDLE